MDSFIDFLMRLAMSTMIGCFTYMFLCISALALDIRFNTYRSRVFYFISLLVGLAVFFTVWSNK